jgi:hypothetical protein
MTSIPVITRKLFLAASSELKEDREQFEIFICRDCRASINLKGLDGALVASGREMIFAAR